MIRKCCGTCALVRDHKTDTIVDGIYGSIHTTICVATDRLRLSDAIHDYCGPKRGWPYWQDRRSWLASKLFPEDVEK